MTQPRATPSRSDVLVAEACATITLATVLLLPVLSRADPSVADGVPEVGDTAWWAMLANLAVQSGVLAWRRQHPEVVAGVSAAAVVCGAAVGMGAAIGLTSIALLIAIYTLVTLCPASRVWPLLTAAGLLAAAGHTVAGLRDDAPVGEAVLAALAQAVVLVGAPVVVATLVLTRRESRSAREDRMRALEREHDALVLAAVARERTAMARELHDIAAHHLTGIAVMSAAIATQIDTDPTGAKAAVGDVRRQSTAVLRDLRNLVGLLRDHDGTEHTTGTAPRDVVRSETLAGIPTLVREVVAAGQDVTLTVLEHPDRRTTGVGIGPLAQLAAYRTVQESLANAGRHAPDARCEIEVDDRDPAALVVTVRNERAPRMSDPEARGGLGLVGMRERAELTGSQLEVGPTTDDGWQVRLRTPRAAPQEPTGEPTGEPARESTGEPT
ncbi:MAG: histidine kinase [Nocardioides sp.]|nr:histidine kinase [Nocardioides sp.]